MNPVNKFGKKDGDEAELLHKAAHHLTLKFDATTGKISGYGSKWDLKDSYGEIVMRGAFTKSLAAYRSEKRGIPMLWQHRSGEPIGLWNEFEEDSVGLKLTGQINLETQRGREAASDIKAQIVTGLSIGYYEIVADTWNEAQKNGYRRLHELDLREVSPVTFPALREAQIDAVKARLARGEKLTIREFEMALREKLNFSHSDAKLIAARGYKAFEGRDGSADVDLSELASELRQLQSILSE